MLAAKAQVAQTMLRERERVLGQAMKSVQSMSLLESAVTADPHVDFRVVSEGILHDCGLREVPKLTALPPHDSPSTRSPPKLKHRSPQTLQKQRPKSKMLTTSYSYSALQKAHHIYGAVDTDGWKTTLDVGSRAGEAESSRKSSVEQAQRRKRVERSPKGPAFASSARRAKEQAREAEAELEELASRQHAVLLGLLEHEKATERERQVRWILHCTLHTLTVHVHCLHSGTPCALPTLLVH
jgi:hypothetical protein